MQAIDDFESGICRMINSEFVSMIKRIGLIVYSAGPAISRSSVELIEPLVALYDTDNHGKDVKVAALMDLRGDFVNDNIGVTLCLRGKRLELIM